MGNLCVKDSGEPDERRRISAHPASPALASNRAKNKAARQAAAAEAAGTGVGRSSAQGIATGGSSGAKRGAADPDDAAFSKYLGTSHTDRRQEEYEEIRGIIESTQQKFIDVAQPSAPLDAKDAEERVKAYQDRFNKDPDAAVASIESSLFVLPTSAYGAEDMEALAQILAQQQLSGATVEEAHGLAADVADTLGHIRVNAVQEFVVPAEQFAM